MTDGCHDQIYWLVPGLIVLRNLLPSWWGKDRLPETCLKFSRPLEVASFPGNFLLFICFHVKISRNKHIILGNHKQFCGKGLPWLFLSQCCPCLGGKFSSLVLLLLLLAGPKDSWLDTSDLPKTEETLEQLEKVTQLVVSFVTMKCCISVFLEGSGKWAAELWTI